MHHLKTTQDVGTRLTDEQLESLFWCAMSETASLIEFKARARALLVASEASAEPDAYERAFSDAVMTGTGMVKVEYVAPADYAALHLTPEQAAKEAK